ncbi:sensor histidine kinase [Microvirga puerhi]|uniref:histidine kinase n=1 Tax=Microvirga puerhi TaxID=2876078 RepID=A0ABS7VNT9_9HYPH|nr:HAMP domain-containing sensor histidine kinase [Microvirga puerhi]MBZ6076755.1 HAMP domain-containing histidine kinase [Microvirga puerhi]
MLKESPKDLEPGNQVERHIEALEREIAALRNSLAARDAFLAVAAHELRNPMTPILAHVQRLRRLTEAPGLAQDDLLRGLGRLEKLIEHYIRRATALLEVSRMTTGKRRLEPETFDLAALLRDVAETAAPAAQYVGSSISLEAPGELCVHTDPLAMEQILDNLVSNAVKYGGGQPIELVLRSTPARVVLEVRDRGIGISPADQSRIFSQFERAVGRGSAVGGFGVGLWVVGQLVEAMGADIQVQSAPNQGTTVTLRLPHNRTERS